MKTLFLFAIGAAITLASVSRAATSVISATASSGFVNNAFGGGGSGAGILFAGELDEGWFRSGIAIFPLPTIPAGEVIIDANLDLNLFSVNLFDDWNVDLYAIDTRATPVLDDADAFDGANDPGATKIMDNFQVLLSEAPWQPPFGVYETDTPSDSVLTAWLNSHYSGENPDNTFAFFRVNADANPGLGTFQLARYDMPHLTIVTGAPVLGDYNSNGSVDAADYTVWRDGNSPDSSINGYNTWVTNFGSTSSATNSTSVPEPSSILLLLGSLLGFVSLRPATVPFLKRRKLTA